MQTEKPVYEEIEELLAEVEPPRVALVEQSVDNMAALGDVRAAVGEALRSVEVPGGSVAIGVGSRGVSEERVGCPVRATMEAVKVGETPAGVEVFMDRNAYEADSVVVVNRIKPHTAFRGTVESGPTKMLAIGLGKQK